MREIAQSSLSDIKSVFSSADDNVHYYRVLENSIGSKIGPLHFAQPVVHAASGSIRWRANIQGDLIPYSHLTAEVQSQVANTLQEGYRILESKFRSFRNIPEGFHNRIIDIPGFESILVKSSEPQEIVLINWGFLEDKLERKEGLLRSIFPAPDCSILARLSSLGGIPVAGEEVNLTSQIATRSSLTDQQGIARLGNLPRGTHFKLTSPQGTFEDAQFVSEENAEYRLTQLRKISLTFRIINQQKIPLSQKDWTFGYAGGSPITLTSDENGEFRVRIPDIGYAYAISNSNNKLIYSGQSGQVDETIEIILDEDRVNTEAQTPEVPIISPSEDSILPFTLQYVEKGGRGIANMPFELDDGSSGKQNFVTDAEGKVLMPSLIANLNYRTKFRYSNRDLAFDFVNPSGSMGHKFLLREKIPWLWWLLCALLLALLLWCLLGTPCWCDLFRSSEQSEVVIPAINVQPCNQQIASGGAGITENVHELGNEPGLVILNYDMANVPDFLQIFYNGNVVTSTQEIGGNEDGFVGGNNAAGQSGQISFYYDAKGSSQCLVRVTGPDSTQWQYLLGCPQIGVLNNNTK